MSLYLKEIAITNPESAGMANTLATIATVVLALACSQLNAQGQLLISGFIDGSTALPVDEGTNLGFSFDQLEIDLEKELSETVSLRADIDFMVDMVAVEQAYVSFKPIKFGELIAPVITFGKFNAPIGYELLDAPDMYQFSHSLVFDNALPTNLTGFSISQDLGAGLDLVAYIANGWYLSDGSDVNFADDSLMIFGGRLGYGGVEGLGLGVSAIQNDAQDMIIDLDGEVTMVPNLILGFEFNTGGKDDTGDNISGWLVMANYAFPSFAITFRQDAWGAASSTTISPSYGIADGAGMLFEYRLDSGTFDEDGVYHKGKNTSAAIEFTFTF
ncbi:MAG: outer membrane beta-barrel protein [Candidatus Marinimicrobia bacterium]|nr:outer membrane beta-barrel protein [Candidatus Neomarinimicrobiota bacterium]